MKRPAPIIVWTAIGLLAVGVLGWLFGPSGRVYGIEFSPDSFSHRTFVYHEWCGIRCTLGSQDEWRSDVDTYLHNAGYVTPTEQERWHLVKGFAPHIRGWGGSAKFMCQSLGCWDGDNKWVQWSHDNPELADIVWPNVVNWARQEKYDEVMWLFRYTELEDAQTPDDVRARVSSAIANANL